MKTSLLALRRFALLLALALAALPLAACAASYSHTDISQVSTNELPGTVTAFKVQVTQGGIVTAHIAPFNSDEKPMIGGVASHDPTVLEVQHASGADVYAFLGVRPGQTTIEFKADGTTVATIQAEVVAQNAQ